MAPVKEFMRTTTEDTTVRGGVLGAALARMEMISFFSALLPRLKSVELNGEPKLVATTFVGGLKHLPIRYSPNP